LPIFAKFCLFLPNFAYFCQILPIFAKFCLFLPNVAYFCQILPIFAKFLQKMAKFGFKT